MRKFGLFLAITCASLAIPRPAAALPVFAHRYGFSCEVCHTAIPRLTPFGQAFLKAGFRLPPSLPARRAFPIALKVNLAYSSAANPSGLPKALVDEVELLAGAPVTPHVSYRVEQYAVDGGVPGKTRDAWLTFTSRPHFADSASALRITAGQFTLPLPLDPETQRDTANHYGIFDQTVGANPFNFFDDKIGVDAAYGKSTGGGTDLHVLALLGHDAQSGLSSLGWDRMAYVQTGSSRTVLSAYRYDGSRPLGFAIDRFSRSGIAVDKYVWDAEFDALVQRGRDSAPDDRGLPVTSSGGYLQLRWIYSPALFSIVRYDRTNDGLSGTAASLTTSLIFRPSRDARLTLEDVTARGAHTLNAGWLFAY